MKKQIRFGISVLALVVTAALLLSCAADRGPATPRDRMEATLSALGAADAQLADPSADPALSDEGCLLYTSDAAQMGYYFDPNTGVLTDIFSYDILGGTYREQTSTAPAAPMQFSPANRDTDLTEYARACIGADLFGTLQLQVDQGQGQMRQYTVAEYYDGFKTGTTVVFTGTTEGQILMCNVAIGSIFERAEDGTYVFAGGSDLIGEEAALEIARASLTALMDPPEISSKATCFLDASEDLLIYTIRIGFTDKKWIGPGIYRRHQRLHRRDLAGGYHQITPA